MGGQSTYAVKVPTSDSTRTYWIEFRQPIGFDSPLSGLPNLGAQIRVESTGWVSGDDTTILDLTPGDGNFDNATLLATAPSYVDSSTGLTISVNSATGGSSGLLTVTVAMGGRTTTTTTLGTSGTPANPGVAVTFTATVVGNAPTGSVSFTADGSPLCSRVGFTGGSGNIRTAACSSSALTAGVHSIVATYSGDAANQSSFNAPALSQVINAGGGGGGGGDVIWVEDAVPAGAAQIAEGDGWTWVSSSPAPISGALAHQSALLSGVHQHYFYDATATLSVGIGDTLYAYVYLDPANPPSEVMLQWSDGTFAHRAYWGANLIGLGSDGSISRRYMGALPATGQWVRLAVPAALVGLEGATINGMAFTLNDGRATWDRAGKNTP